MKTTRFVLIALLAGLSVLAPVTSQAKTVFERFAPPLLLPVPVPVPGFVHGPEIRVETAPAWHDNHYRDNDRRYDRRYDRYDRYDDRRDWRDDHRRYDHHDRRHDRRDYDRR